VRILALNVGSTSIKYKVFQMPEEKEICGGKVKSFEEIPKEGYSLVISRVVHGGPLRGVHRFSPAVEKTIREFSKFAPHHNPYNLEGILYMEKLGKENYVIFDSIHPEDEDFILPQKVKNKFGFLKKYGFHGISVSYIVGEAKKMNLLDFVVCHVGGGTSVSAVKNGKIIYNSMELTPLSGPFMMSRSGSLDPGLVLFLCREFGIEETDRILNFECGFEAVGVKHFPDASREMKRKFAQEVAKYVLFAFMKIKPKNKVVILSGGIGENSNEFKRLLENELAQFGEFTIYQIKTNEELHMVRSQRNFLQKGSSSVMK